LAKDQAKVAAFAEQVRMASAAFKPAENLVVGDRVTINAPSGAWDARVKEINPPI
jgi:ribosomal 50S subunit-recycling heat shock protein